MPVTARVVRKATGRLKKISAAVAEARRSEVAVGFPKGKTEGSMIDRASWNNFGTSRIPPRPFMQNAMRDNRSNYASAMRSLAKSVYGGSASVRTGLNKLGIYAQGHIQAEIVSLRGPANAASTVKQKGSSNPLIDTGEMRQAVTYHVRGK